MQARADANTAVVDAKRERKEAREKEARKARAIKAEAAMAANMEGNTAPVGGGSSRAGESGSRDISITKFTLPNPRGGEAGGLLRTSTRPTLNRQTKSACPCEHSP